MTGTGLGASVRHLLGDAVLAYGDAPAADALRDALERLDGPLRVAFAGRLKAGKSTLLNALVGEPLAATDATECTRIVTWYVSGPAVRVWAHPFQGAPVQVRFGRDHGGTHVDLGGLAPTDVDRLVVETPNSRLHRLSLVDTPGLASRTSEASARTRTLLVDDGPGVDAVLYLMRHVHATDVGFLQSFHDDQFAGTAPVNAIGVLSRADELAGGHPNALDVAGGIADRYAADPRVRALVQDVVPVSGLLGLAAVGLQESQFQSIARLARASPSALLSSDRLVRAQVDVPREELERLLAGFGLFGIRYCVALVREGRASDATALAAVLRADCGLERLRALLVERFVGRAEALKAEASLRVLEAVLEQHPVEAAETLRRRVEQVVAGAHVLTEMRTLTALRTGALTVADDTLVVEAERLLGGDGDGERARLGLVPETPDELVRPAVVAAVQRWQRLGQNPMADAGTRRVAEVVRRTCEGML